MKSFLKGLKYIDWFSYRVVNLAKFRKKLIEVKLLSDRYLSI